jgi:hypothetical protein
MAANRGTRKSRGAVAVGDDEAALGMGVGAGNSMVMGAERSGNLAQGDGPLGAGLALPEESEALAADGTAEIRGINNDLAQNLHVFFWPFVVPCSNRNGEH